MVLTLVSLTIQYTGRYMTCTSIRFSTVQYNMTWYDTTQVGCITSTVYRNLAMFAGCVFLINSFVFFVGFKTKMCPNNCLWRWLCFKNLGHFLHEFVHFLLFRVAVLTSERNIDTKNYLQNNDRMLFYLCLFVLMYWYFGHTPNCHQLDE